MTSKQTKRIAFLLAASLLMNTAALPVSAESDVAIVEEAPTEAPTEAPVEIATESPTEAPTAEAATEAPTEAVTEAPTEEATEAPAEGETEAPTEGETEAPTEGETEAPTEEATEAPTEEAPSEEPTEPLTREDILAAQQEGYQQALSHFRSMDISDDRTMSLEWWCVMTGNVSMREPDYSILDAQEEIGAPQEETTEKAWADYIVFSEVISVRSASDLILLSYVSPSLYQNRTVTLFADAGNEFDLVHPLSVTAERTLNYRGMGDLGSPFSGTIRYAENSENITFVLDAPLFIGLSTKAKFLNSLNQPNTIFLVSKAGFAFDGLLARHILGEQQDEANWFIQLNAPDFTGGAVYVLPSLLGILYGNANVSLLLTDNSCLSPSPRGYLCATMYAQSSLSAWNITRSVSVPLVGEKADDAVLTTDAILPTEPTEEATEPATEVTEPTEEVTEPTEEVTEPTEEVTEPTEGVTEPTGEATEPTEEVTEPTEEVTEPTGEATEPTGEATEPTGEATEPTGEATEPTEEVTEPTEEVTEPTEVTEPNQDATEPTEDAIAPTQPGKIPMYYEEMSDEEFNALVAYYCAMPIVPGKMPLEWWFAVCGKLAELRAYLALKSQEPAPLPDEFDVKEVDSSTDSTLPTIITYPEPTETETPAPTGASAQNEPEDIQATEAPEALLLDAPEAAAMADEPAAMAAEDAPAAMAETEPPAAEMPLPEDSPAPTEATVATEATEATEAAEDDAAAEPGDTTGADEGIAPQAEIKLDISSTDDLIKLSCVDAAEYQHETITVTASSSSINLCDKLSGGSTTFQGLGSDAAPFAGTFQYSGGSEKTSITLNRAFFNALSAGATIDHINLSWAGIVDDNADAAILALTVTEGTGSWTVNLDKHTGDTSTTENYRLPALIHTIAAGAAVTLTATNASTYPFGGQGFYCDKLNGTLTVNNPILPTFNTTKNNVGGLVGSMTGKATLNVNGNITINVVTSGSTAGGFVGKMEDGATLKISGSTITVQQVSASRVDGSCVGTLVGEATNPTFTFEKTSISAGDASATSGFHLNGRLVGGLVGKLTYSKEAPLSVLPIVGLKLQGHNCGGLFGELYNGTAFSLSYESETTLADVTFSGYDSGSGGGLVGYYQSTAAGASFSAANVRTNLSVNNQRFTIVGGFIANADKAGGSGDTSFTFENAKASLTSGSTANCLGGFIGTVGGGGNTYVTLTGCTVENCAPSDNITITNLGGMVGKLGSSVTHLKVTGSTVTCDFNNDNHGSTGGIVGLAEDQGHLIEVDTFTLTAATIKGNNCGGLVGKMDSGVLYLHNVPTLNITNIPSGASHGWIVGNRGNALVCSKEAWIPIAASNPDKELNDTGIWGQVLQLSQFDENLVTLDSQTHNVSIRALPQKEGDYYAIGSLTDFASVALRLQHSSKGMMTIDSDISGGAVNLNLNTNIDLTGTGLTGLTRDNSVSESYGFDIQGNGNTITLPNVKIFAAPGSHIFQGLIGQCRSGLTLNKLTVAGGSEIFCPNYQNTSVHCGIVGEMRSSATITSTNSSVSWTLGGWAKGSNLSGFIAVTSVNNELNFTDSTWMGSLVDISGTDGGVCRLGGFIANGFYNEGQKPSITVTSCTIGGTVRNTVSKDYEAAMGGLFGSLRYCQKLDINGLTVSTNFQSSSKKASGGLLGYELNCDNATFSGVVIEKAKLTTDTKFGGLIYKGAGHWKVQGIHFKSATISGQTDDKTPSGLLVSIGCSHKDVGGYEGLYLEVAHGAYKIEPDVKVTISGGKYFDELVGRSIYDASSGRNGIVSIATENAAPIDQNGCNTYKNQLQNWENPCTRYYYNLDTILAKADTSTTIDSPEKMVLWSAYNECRNCTKGGAIGGASASICGFFQKGNRNLITGDIDLSGYSFYPVVFDGTSIENATITFSFKELDDAEANNKKPSDSQRQHAGMHTGIFKEITSKNAALSVQNLTLKGTVGSLGSSGALVRDNVVGAVRQSENDKEATQLNIKNVTLSNIRVLPAPTGDRVSPLLIGSIGSHVKLQLKGVTASDYEANTTAASSLIGNVGDSTATNIDLKFSEMNLSPADNKANCTLFTHALFLESFQYSTGCRGVYNFTSKENYTIGREVSNTNTDTGRNPGKQHWFFYEWDTASGLVAGENGADAKAFTRYVAQEENGSYHELDVNLQPLDLIEGCGTYSDPYRITDGKVLWEVAKALKNDGKNETWKVRINTEVLPSTGAAPDFSQDDGHIHDGATGEQELVLECDADGKWHIADSTDTQEIDSALMREYLRNAYYMITSDIELPSEWTGLGTVSAPFRGVIVGQKEGKENHTVTVTTTGAQQFGGLVLFSQGSVIKNLDIAFRSQDKFTISGSGSIKDYSSAVFFGGVVGCCNAGDTVIDSVTVTLPKAFSFPGYYVVVGGYVGLVGGANNQGGGGVVFRSISNPGDPTAGSQFTYPYSGPFVGRVLDGYAVSETPIDKWNKNYQVPTLDNPSLTFNGDTVTVGNGDGLWLLSAMENSRHGGAYTNGKPRTCAYGTVGQPIPDDVKGDETGSGQTSFYLWKHYGKTELPTSFQLVFTGDCNMTDFGNGFRGIGVSQGTFRAYLNDYPVITGITGIDGKIFTVTLSQTREEPNGEAADWSIMGVGLFPVLNAGQNMVIQNLNLTGTANLSVGDRATNETPVFHGGYQRTMVGAGMLAGALINRQAGANITIQNVTASGSVVTNALMAGGLIGYCGSPVTKINGAAAFGKPASITVKECNANGVTVKASSIFGGFIGFGYANAITIDGCTASGITLAATGPKNDGVYWNSANNQSVTNGVGGIIGTVYQAKLNIENVRLSTLSLNNSSMDGNLRVGFGGIVGSLVASGDGSLSNITMEGTLQILGTGHASIGGLIGLLTAAESNNTQASLFGISNIRIATEAASSLNQQGYFNGGIVGKLDGKIQLTIGGESISEDGTKNIFPVKIGNAETMNVTISRGTNNENGLNSGVLGTTDNNPPAITIQHLHLAGVTVNIAALTSFVFPGGYASSTITLKNSEFVSCKLQRKDSRYSGYLLGSSWGKIVKFDGFNLLLKDCNTEAPGIFAGEINNNGSYVHLTAVSLVNCSGGARDFYSGNDAYAIRANYTGDQGYKERSSNPWMDCNPLSDLNGLVDGITTPIAGNGAAFMADGKTPVASKIVEDSKTGSTIGASKRHYNASAAADFFAANDYGISISTFSAAGGNASTAGMPDFPVLVVPPLGRMTASKSIYGYISLLTNTPSDATTLTSKLKGSITAQTYQWNEGKFTAITDSSITVEQDGTIHVMPGKYDNTLNQFTLLTVSYQDPTYAGNSYKLYIPIVVQKLLNYHFYASAISGTLYNRKPYETVDSLVVTTHGDQVTVLLSYVYDNGKTGSPAIAEWQNSIDNGDNLLWNFDKKIMVARDGNNDLPTGTKLTLVDRNNRDRAYYATYDGSGIIPLNSFKDAAEQPYEKNALCDAMGLEAKKDDNGLFVTTDKATATVRVGETYYRPAADSDTGTRYSITVGNATLLEEYYLTIQTPANSEELSNVKIQCEASLKNETGDTMLPNKFIEADSQHPYTRNNAENRILFGNFFQQTVTVTTNTPEEISDANNTINATLTVAINYKSDAWKERFAPYAKSIQLYQRFELQAMDWTGGTSASTSFTDRTATVRYLNGTTPVGSAKATKLGAEGIMVLKFPESVTVSTNTGLNAATLVAEVSLAYTSDQIQAQFHTRSNNTDGLQLWANSHLAFSDAALERSNNPTSGYDAGRFYRTESTPATLVYNANGTDVDARVNQLGVNGRVQDAASIDSVATYNVSVLDTAKNADTIRYAITLYRKDDNGNFVLVDADELLTVGDITATLADRTGTEQTVKFGETFTGGIDPSIPIRISLPLTVATGNGFTGTYANYQVVLRVWLQNGNAQITGSEATDYIIYTNAKIKFPLVTSN